MAPQERARGNRHKLKHRKFHSDVIKNFFIGRAVEHWSRLPRESSSLETFQTELEKS